MTFGKKQGLWLIQRDAGRGKETWLPETVAAVLACLTQVLALEGLTGFGQSWTMAISGVYLCIFYGVLTKLEKRTWFFPGVLLVMACVVFLCRSQVLAGFCQFRQRLGEALTRGTGWVLPELDAPQANETVAAGLLAALCGAAMAVLSCYFTTHLPQLLAVLLPAATLVGMALLGREAEMALLLPVLGCAVLLLLYGGWAGQRALTPRLLSWGSCALVFSGVLVLFGLTGMGGRGESVSGQLHRSFHEYRYETKYTVLPEGDFRQTPASSAEGLPGLLVTMSRPQEMYLRGFAGCTFEDNVWQTMDRSRLGENRDLLYWLNQGDIPLNAQFSAASGQLEMESGTVTIENIGACSENLYIPLGLVPGDWLEAENLNQDTLCGGGSREYSYTVAESDENAIARVLEYLQTSEEPWVIQYRKAESAYRDFIFDNYTQVPQSASEMLGKRWDAIAASYGTADNLTLRQAQECVLIFLESCFGEESDKNQLLPLDTARGTSYQYATVAVLALRYFGIPARYAEGYVISGEMAAGVEPGAPLEVTSGCAGAWPEVYQDGIGWIPMALTPGFGELLRQASGSGQSQSDAQAQEEPSTQETESVSQEEPDTEGGTVTRLEEETVLPLVIFLLVLLLFLLTLVCRRKYLLGRKQEKFRKELGNEAISWLFADVALLLEAVGLNRGNGSMRQLCGDAGALFGEDYGRRLLKMIQYNDESLFRSCVMTDGQWQDMMAFHQDTVACLRAQVKWYRRSWLKWIRCLY